MDASITAAWYLKSQTTAYSEAVNGSLQRGCIAFVPSIWPTEVVNIFAVAERRKLLSESQMRRAFDALEGYDIRVDANATLELVFRDIGFLARRYQRSAYDASYLELALREGLPLATKDEALRQSATAAGVELFDPEL